MADLKPFLLHLNGEERIVEAVNLGVALVHAIEGLTKAKPATGAELSKFIRSGKKVETAGETPVDITELLPERELHLDTQAEDMLAAPIEEHVMPEVRGKKAMSPASED